MLQETNAQKSGCFEHGTIKTSTLESEALKIHYDSSTKGKNDPQKTPETFSSHILLNNKH